MAMSLDKIIQKSTRKSVGGVAFELSFDGEQELRRAAPPPVIAEISGKCSKAELTAEELANKMREAEERRLAALRQPVERNAEQLRKFAERELLLRAQDEEERKRIALDTEMKEVRRMQVLEEKRNSAKLIVRKADKVVKQHAAIEESQRAMRRSLLEKDLEEKENRRREILDQVKSKAIDQIQRVEKVRENWKNSAEQHISSP